MRVDGSNNKVDGSNNKVDGNNIDIEVTDSMKLTDISCRIGEMAIDSFESIKKILDSWLKINCNVEKIRVFNDYVRSNSFGLLKEIDLKEFEKRLNEVIEKKREQIELESDQGKKQELQVDLYSFFEKVLNISNESQKKLIRLVGDDKFYNFLMIAEKLAKDMKNIDKKTPKEVARILDEKYDFNEFSDEVIKAYNEYIESDPFICARGFKKIDLNFKEKLTQKIKTIRKLIYDLDDCDNWYKEGSLISSQDELEKAQNQVTELNRLFDKAGRKRSLSYRLLNEEDESKFNEELKRLGLEK